ncbi:hypothetical protein [Desulfovibrio ferrophilus]|uniref:Rod shape-determining protein MreD n=1 Tax=Desulfovibrio ferrophilus TaxID=241368 RepID=A0A2Z6B2C2_9BACT|nr:hypothetical protein [Desulfovibrio ferrophilus]BBD09667.1 uncharacterized protein DFE_2941 [Desulfovibrio ferrophilus]
MHPVVFWLIFTVIGVWAQRLLPGVDFFAPALVVCLQQRRITQFVWLTLAWIILQEGMGNLPFGNLLLWYSGLVLIFVVGRWLFESRNLIFVFIIGIFMGSWHFLLTQIMTNLQVLEVNRAQLLLEGVHQAVIFPLAWAITYNVYKRMVPDVGPL